MIRFVIPAYNEVAEHPQPARRPGAACPGPRGAGDHRRRRLDRRHQRRDRAAPPGPAPGDRAPQGQPRPRDGASTRACGRRSARPTTTTAIVTLEADNTSDLDDLPAMLARASEGYDVVPRIGLRAGRPHRRRRAVAPGGLQGGLEHVPHGRRPAARSTRCRRCTASTAPARCAARPRPTATCWCASPASPPTSSCCSSSTTPAPRSAEVPTVNDWTRRKGVSKMNLKPTVLAYGRLMAAHLVGRIQPPPISPLAGEDVEVLQSAYSVAR